jgi:Ca2+-binding RTX toxin-like protein
MKNYERKSGNDILVGRKKLSNAADLWAPPMIDYVGTGGNDAFVGTEQNDTASGGGGDDALIGNGGNDILSGDSGADYLEGGAGDDILFSGVRDQNAFTFISYRAIANDFGTEVDTLIGGDGDDYFIAGFGDNVDGGTQGSYGNRLYISFRGASSGVNADFRLLQTSGSITIGGGTITNIQTIGYLEGSEFDDFLVPIDTFYPTGANVYGRGGNDHILADYYTGWGGSGLYGGDGNDTIDARGGQYSPSVYGEAGDDILYGGGGFGGTTSGGDGNDTIEAAGTINGDAGDDTITIRASGYGGIVRGGTGHDVINSSDSSNFAVYGDDGNDTLNGAAAYDVLDGGAGNDAINGGAQTIGSSNYSGDIAVYSGNLADYQVTENAGIVTIVDMRSGSPDGTDTLNGIEILRFSNGNYSVAAVLSGQASAVMNFVGTPGVDTYHGNEDANTAIGYASADSFYGYGGNDILQGNAGGDYLDGGDGDDTLYAGDITGSYSTPYYGNPWTPPTLDTGAEQDTLIGGNGNDTFFAGYGDNVDGGSQNAYGDILLISFMGATSGVTVNFNQATVTVGGATITGIENINWVQGSAFDDDITLGGGNGYGAFTPMFGMGGNDRLVANYYAGYMDGGDGNDIVDGRNSQYLQSVVGGAGDDTLYTNTNTFSTAYGGDGNDTIYAHGTIYGDAGNDTIYIQQSYYPGQVRGGTGNDTIYAASGGSSAVFGEDGEDILIGGVNADTMDGGIGNDRLVGGGGLNVLTGGAGNDRFELTASDSNSVINGGADFDTLAITGAVTIGGALSGIEAIELTTGTLTLSGSQVVSGLAAITQVSGTGTIIVNMQPNFAVSPTRFQIQPGSNVNFTINGTSNNDDLAFVAGATANALYGNDGADRLKSGSRGDLLDGGAGTDKIVGNGGADILTGGTGADVFKFRNASDSGLGSAADTITDFVSGTDKLNFSKIDTDLVSAGDQGFAFVGSGAFTGGGSASIRYTDSGGNLLVQADVNGDGVADMEVVLQGLAGGTLTAGDFVL